MNENLISIIIPVYNIEKIKGIFYKTIKSILIQTFSNFELILVNDGSKDNTALILDSVQKKDKRIVIINKENGGVESARREGLKYARGAYVFHIDQDDYIRKHTLETLLRKIDNADVAVANSTRFILHPIINFGKSHLVTDQVIDHKKFMSEYYVGFFGIYKFPVNIWNKLYRKSFLDSIPNPPTTGLYNEDLSYNLHILPYANRIALIEDTLYYYRWGGFTSKRINELLEVALSCYHIKMKQIKKLNLLDFEVPTCIELLNYIHTYFYQIAEYDNFDLEDFSKLIDKILNLEELKHAINVVKNYNNYHNGHVDKMLNYDARDLANYEIEIVNSNKIKKMLKNIISRMLY